MFPIYINETEIVDKVADCQISFVIGETQGWRPQMEDATLSCYINNNG